MAASNIFIRGVEGEKYLNKFSGISGATNPEREPTRPSSPCGNALDQLTPFPDLDGFTVSGVEEGIERGRAAPRGKGLFETWTTPKVD
jgi:hypothetical protein